MSAHATANEQIDEQCTKTNERRARPQPRATRTWHAPPPAPATKPAKPRGSGVASRTAARHSFEASNTPPLSAPSSIRAEHPDQKDRMGRYVYGVGEGGGGGDGDGA